MRENREKRVEITGSKERERGNRSRALLGCSKKLPDDRVIKEPNARSVSVSARAAAGTLLAPSLISTRHQQPWKRL